MADAQFCDFVYIGDEANYQKFKEFEVQARLAREQREAVELKTEAAAQEERMEMIVPLLFSAHWIY